MWISSFPLDYAERRLQAQNPSMEAKAMFLDLDYWAKMSVVIFSALVFICIYILLWKLASFKYASFFSVIFSLEPYLIGMRRLYHLDYLLTILLFSCFLLLVYYSYRSARWHYLLFAGMSFALAILTKSSAVIFLPLVPLIILLGNGKLIRKFLAIVLFLLFSAGFIYIFFPAIWRHPFHDVPRYFTRIKFGVTGIGVNGLQEVGFSGNAENLVLDEVVDNEIPGFYFISLFMRLSVAGIAMLVLGLGVYVYYCIKWPPVFIYRSIKSKSFPKIFTFRPEVWISFWSLCFAIAVLVAFSYATKKSDRYEIIVFPFLITVAAYFLNKTRLWVSLPIIFLYSCFVVYELKDWHPYYLAYSNPLLGGIETRLNVLDRDPFGIGTYAVLDVVNKNRQENGESGFYTLSGSKSQRSISAGAKYSRGPSCVTDYAIVFAHDDKPTYTCVQDYVQVGTVKIGGYDYWYIYKRLNQKHESQLE
jgi:hypothetical protein